MDISFSTSLSGVRTATQRQAVSAHDVANINTGGYGQKTLHQAEQRPSGVRATAISETAAGDPQFSTTDLAQEAGEQISARNDHAANLKVMKVADRMLGTLLDIVG